MATATGCCPVCRRRYRLRKDRTLQSHYAGSGILRDICAGTGQPDRWAEHNRLARERAATPTIIIKVDGELSEASLKRLQAAMREGPL